MLRKLGRPNMVRVRSKVSGLQLAKIVKADELVSLPDVVDDNVLHVGLVQLLGQVDLSSDKA
jgi:hypothetical protein